MAKKLSGQSGLAFGGHGAPSGKPNSKPKFQHDVMDWVREDANRTAAKMLGLGHPKSQDPAPGGTATLPGRSNAR
jgi:muramoyltetrapeptide carboxypeptidase LdcA involved in peptidoglycan recycling